MKGGSCTENLSVILTIRVTPTTKASLELAAWVQRRDRTELARMAIEDMLTAKGYPITNDNGKNKVNHIPPT